MSDVVPQRIPFQGVRIRYDSGKTFDDLVRALKTDVGEEPVRIEGIAAASTDWADYRARVAPHAGPHGFMLFATLDHGGWITTNCSSPTSPRAAAASSTCNRRR
ncbi:hypothetical protein [Mycobacterium sp. ZZG]